MVNAAGLPEIASEGRVNPRFSLFFTPFVLHFMKKLLALSFVVALIFPSASSAFSDVSEHTTYKEAINWMIQQDIIEDKGKFFPDRIITKAEIFEMAWRAAGYKPEQLTHTTTPFSDVSSSSRFAPYVKRAAETGLVPTNGNFLPNTRMNRADSLEIIFDVLGIGITRVFEKNNLPFKDIKMNTRNAPIAKTALEFGIRSNQKEFKPREKLSRGEVAHYIYTISTLTPSPIPSVQIIELRSSLSDSTFTQNEKFKILVDVWDKIHEKYVGKEPIDDKKLLYGAINGMVNKLGDKYTVFQEPVAAKGFTESLSGEFDGIGISIDLIENKVRIISPIQGTPASKSGLKANDIIVQVDKKPVDGLSLNEVSSMIKGQTGTQVELLIEREGKKITFIITRERIKLEAIVGEMKGKVAYIIIRNFSQASGAEFAQQVKKLMAKNPTSFVIDLRDNPGGYLDASLQMLDIILPKETRLASLKFSQRDNAEEFFATQVSGGSGRAALDPTEPEVIFYSVGTGELSKYPIKVLINGGSASASEIVAASLKENGRATLIGEKSFGKGTVQEITDYIDGSIYKQTIGKWQTPNEKNLTENPIEPDILIKDNPKVEGDEILEYALKN